MFQFRMSLLQFADFLISLGVVNAVNLDGGGSATTVVDGTAVSDMSDACPAPCICPISDSFQCLSYCHLLRCPRAITTIACAHEPLCNDGFGCGAGACVNGTCVCDAKRWEGAACETAVCNEGDGCGNRGSCINVWLKGCNMMFMASKHSLLLRTLTSAVFQGTCVCERSWTGASCATMLCADGSGCGARATCLAGVCKCLAPWDGAHCDQVRKGARASEPAGQGDAGPAVDSETPLKTSPTAPI